MEFLILDFEGHSKAVVLYSRDTQKLEHESWCRKRGRVERRFLDSFSPRFWGKKPIPTFGTQS